VEVEYIDRNLNILNGSPCSPHRVCAKIAGPGDVIRISSATINSSALESPTRSMHRLEPEENRASGDQHTKPKQGRSDLADRFQEYGVDNLIMLQIDFLLAPKQLRLPIL
jgi:hypothetical protein